MKKAIIGIFLLVVIAFLFIEKDAPEFVSNYKGSIVIYYTSWCNSCKKTIEYLESKGVDYIKYNVEESERGMKEFRSLGGRAVPLLLIDGKVVIGYNPEAISDFIDRR